MLKLTGQNLTRIRKDQSTTFMYTSLARLECVGRTLCIGSARDQDLYELVQKKPAQLVQTSPQKTICSISLPR